MHITIDPNRKHQTIEGFGASGAWWHTWVSDFPTAEQERILDLLFSRTEGAGLSIFRYNVPAGSGMDVLKPDRRTVDLEVKPFEYDFARDEVAINYLLEARRRGVERFVLFSNSPPARMTINGLTSGGPGGGSNLAPERVKDFARYLADIAEHFQETYDLPHLTLSPINEPQWKWGKEWRGQEGAHYTPSEVVNVLRAVILEVQQRGLPIEIEGPESGKWEDAQLFAKAMYADPLIDRFMPHFAVHSYWSNREDKRTLRAWFEEHAPDKKLAMTEFCIMEHERDLSMDSALRVANVIHDDLTIGGVVSWTWWLGVGMGHYKDGLIYAVPETQEVLVSKILWVLGNYAKHVRPGAVRLDTSGARDKLRATAFIDLRERRLIFVAINSDGQAADVKLNARGIKRISPIELFVTDVDHNLESKPLDGMRFPVPPRSVVTAIYRLY